MASTRPSKAKIKSKRTKQDNHSKEIYSRFLCQSFEETAGSTDIQSKHNTKGTISALVAGKIRDSVKLNQSDLGKRSSMDEHDQVTVP
jgi:hypothetical protein